MSAIVVRPGRASDLEPINEIYNHYVLTTAITFDMDAITLEARRSWFQQFSAGGRHQLFVAEEKGALAGYADSHQFRAKKAYDTTVETTAYCAPDATGRGIGRLLYEVLFDALQGADLWMAVAGITLPNAASVALHERFGFSLSGVMHEVGRKFDRYWDVGWYQKRLL